MSASGEYGDQRLSADAWSLKPKKVNPYPAVLIRYAGTILGCERAESQGKAK